MSISLIEFQDIFQLIADNYLTYFEKLCLNEVIPIKLQNFDKDIQNVFKNNGISYNNFKAKLNDNTFCTGGILLGILLNNINPNSDIDLYHFKFENNIYQPVKQIEVDTGPDVNYREIRIYDKPDHQGEWLMMYGTTIIKTEGTSNDNRMYQHNTLSENTQSLCKYIDKHSDFDFTKIIYYQNKLYIKNFQSILKKECDYDILYDFNFQIYQLMKHNNFIYNDNISINPIVYRMNERIKKYKERGFKINLYYDSKIKISQNIFLNLYKNICDKYLIYSINDLKRLSKIERLSKNYYLPFNNNPFSFYDLNKINDDEKLNHINIMSWNFSHKDIKKLSKEFDEIFVKYDLLSNVKLSTNKYFELLKIMSKIIENKKLNNEYEKISSYYLNLSNFS